MPANAIVQEAEAELIVDALVSEGKRLEDVLCKMGVVTGEAWAEMWSIEVERLTHFFWNHCVVMTGHLASHCWPRYKKETGEKLPVTLCTCQCFGQHLECEHLIYVLGLNAKPGEKPDLGNLPNLPPQRGRPKKAVRKDGTI